MTKIRFSVARRPSGGSKEPRRPSHEVAGQVGGGSPFGSTTYKRARLCPYEDGLVRVARLRPTRTKEELDVGWICHGAREVYYNTIKEHQDRLGEHPPPENDTRAYEHYFWGAIPQAEQAGMDFIDLYKEEPGYLDTWETCARTMAAWFEHWKRQDRWRILSVEETLIYQLPLEGPLTFRLANETQLIEQAAFSEFAYSARLDTVVLDYAPSRRGIWVPEFKTTKWISEDLLDGYQLDMQVLGQVWLMRNCVDLEAYNAPFKGAVVDIVSKQANPKCERLDVNPSPYHLAAFEASTKAWAMATSMYEALGYPRALGSCAGALRGYSRCQYYDLCHGRPEMGVHDWAEQEDPPAGFYREERMLEDPSEYEDYA